MKYSRHFFKKTYLQPRIKRRVENDEFAEIANKERLEYRVDAGKKETSAHM